MDAARRTYPRTPPHQPPSAKPRLASRDSPEIAVRVYCISAHTLVVLAFILLEDAGVRGSGDVERPSAVEVQLRARVHVREERVRVK